ncbi:MAG: serine/threonine-protein kinase [Micromonosporaceae bacterium]
MGTVWRASDLLLRREVAVKEVVLPPGLAPSDRDAMYERTLREARAAAALSHPSVVQVYDVVTEDGRPWIVMELLDARSLADIVIEDGPLAPRAVAKIGIALLGALEVAHAAGVLHRDVKPANVLISSDGRCVLTDFGVARMPTDVQLTTPGMVLGSPHFISPERAMGREFGPPSDLFSLGVSLYTAVEGRPPFDRGDPIETMHAVVEDPPAPAVRAGPLAGVLMGLLEKDPARRWDVPTARAVLRDLLAGPLANRSHDHVTDPYAVVPVQRTPTPPAVRSGQIGGRAMLAPGESLADAIARSRAAAASASAPPAYPAAPPAGHPPAPGYPPPAGHPQPPGYPPPAGYPAAPPPGFQPGFPPGATSPGPGRRWRPPALDNLLATLRRWPPRPQVALAGGIVAALLLAIVVTLSLRPGPDDSAGAAPQITGSSAPPADQPLIDEVQAAQHGAMSVNVPAGWTRKEGGVYVDFLDPDADGTRKVRLLIEDLNTTPRRLLESAEKNLMKTSTCPAPYARVDLRDTTLAGQPAAELEYTCGEGEKARHGIWRAIVVDGKAYSFYLTVPDARFAESKVIYEELVRSFQLAA